MKKAIITGSTGFLGMSLAKHLTNNGIDVLCLGRKTFSNEDTRKYFGARATYLKLKMEDILFLKKELTKIAWSPGDQCVFFHFAWGGDQKLTDGGLAVQMNNVIHAAHAVSAARDSGCQKFVNAGTLEETYVEQYLNDGPAPSFKFTQIDYSLAKIAARDMSKMVAYMVKLDYVHTRISVPLLFDLSRGSYIAKTLNNIADGISFSNPENDRLFDIIAVDDLVRAYLMVGKYGKNKADYFIGTSRPSTLVEYFQYMAKHVNNKGLDSHLIRNVSEESLFSTEIIHRDTGFVPLMQFEDIVQRFKRL